MNLRSNNYYQILGGASLCVFPKPPINALVLMFSAIKEKRFAKRATRCLLGSYSAASAENPDLSDRALYREVLLHPQKVDPHHVDQILKQAEDSVDEWTAGVGDGLGFREVVHYLVLLQHLEAGHKGTVISLGDIVNSLIPADL